MDKKYSWNKRISFEEYYYNQLINFVEVTQINPDDIISSSLKRVSDLSVNSSIEEISEMFDRCIDKFKQERKTPLEELKQQIKDLGLLPIDMNINTPTDKILAVNINLLPNDLKDLTSKELQDYLQNEYGCKVFLFDDSKQNTYGSSPNNQPMYFIN